RLFPSGRAANSTDAERVLHLPLRHLRTTFDVAALRPCIKFLARMPVALAGAGKRHLAAARRRLAGIAAAHRARALALSRGADAGLAFALLLRGAAARFLGLGAPQVAAVAPLAPVLRGAGFVERDRNRLAAALDLASLAAAAALELAVLEFMHHPAGDALLS